MRRPCFPIRARRDTGLRQAAWRQPWSLQKPFFVALGIVLAVYTCIAAIRGEVIAKSGPGMRRLRRDDAAPDFRVVIVIHTALALALLLVF